MNPKTVAVISMNYSYYYEVRMKYLCTLLKEMSYKVVYIVSNFDHRTKKYVKYTDNNLISIHTPKYTKNISVKRLWAHFVFSLKVKKYIKNLMPDLIYVSSPPNLIIKYTAQIKKKFSQVKLITEIGDMWPESLPFSGRAKTLLSLPLSIWRNTRNKYLHFSDYVITECDLFKKNLNVYSDNIMTVYLSKDNFYMTSASIDDHLGFLYLGSINNIIDIDVIVELLTIVNQRFRAKLYIVGMGENQEVLLSKLDYSRIDYVFCGPIYDDHMKLDIFNKCHYGLNIMKSSVRVGISLKSIDYIQYGLPIVNNINGDISEIIDKFNIGLTIREPYDNNLVSTLINNHPVYKSNIKKSFDCLFSSKTYKTKMKDIIHKVMEQQEKS